MELTKQKNYQESFDLACAVIKGMELEERARKAGADYRGLESEEKIVINFFSEPYPIHFPQIEFSSPPKKTVSLVTRILLLHYLIRADGSPLTGKWVGYKDIPGGLLYASVFARRVTEPLVRKFGKSAKWFEEIGIKLGGEPAGVGDASFILQVFPFIPLQYVLWEGDEEFPPAVQLLFDASVDHYLSLEAIVVLGQMATGRLIHQATISQSYSPPSGRGMACLPVGRDDGNYFLEKENGNGKKDFIRDIMFYTTLLDSHFSGIRPRR